MEKRRNNTGKKRYNRLLKFFLLCMVFYVSFPAFAQNFNGIQFSQKGDFSVLEDSIFVLELVGVNLADVEVEYRTFPHGIDFVSSEKNNTFIRLDDGSTQKAVSIMYTLRFLHEGEYNLGSVPLSIESVMHTIDFPIVTVHPNLDTLIPELLFVQNDPLYALHTGTFSLQAKYFSSITALSVDLSEQALIEQTSSQVSIPSTDFPFSTEMVALATFSCIPFESGTLELPQILASFIAFNGTEHTITLDGKTLTVFPSENFLVPNYGNERHLLDISMQQADSSVQSIPIDRKESLVQSLAALRISEKYSLLPFESTQERKVLEETENIQNVGEVSYTWAIGAFFFSVVLIFTSVILFKLKKKLGLASLFCFLGIALFALTVLYGKPLLNRYALTYGTQLYTIPEYESNVIDSLYPGLRVQIIRSVGDWYLIEKNDGRSGWILKTDCVLIER